MKPTNLVGRAWKLASGTRLTIACMGLLIVLSAAGLVATALANTAVADWLRMSGLADGPRSEWFVFVLGLLSVNLLCGAAAGLPRAWAEATSVMAAAPENSLRSELETRLGKDAFAEVARKWARKQLGRAPVIEQSGEGLCLSAKRGRYNSFLRWFAHLAFGFALVGGALMLTRGFQARVLVEEGSRARVLELLRGRAPADWKPYENGGRPLPGHFMAGFEIERVPAPEASRDSVSLLRFYEDGKPVGSAAVSPGNPVRFHGLTLHLLGYVPASAQNVSLAVTERSSGAERRFAALTKGQGVDLEDFRFQVLEVQPETDINGPAVQLEYQERGGAAEKFWVFADFPDYDFAHRKPAAQHFTLQSVTPRTAAEILVGREPGAVWLWGGLTLMAMLFWVAMARPEESFWIRWSDGGPSEEGQAPHKVEFAGWGPRSMLFDSRFYNLADLLERRIEKAEAGDARA